MAAERLAGFVAALFADFADVVAALFGFVAARLADFVAARFADVVAFVAALFGFVAARFADVVAFVAAVFVADFDRAAFVAGALFAGFAAALFAGFFAGALRFFTVPPRFELALVTLFAYRGMTNKKSRGGTNR